MNYVALQTDVDAENMYKALTKVRAGLSDIATETSSTAAVALQQLGVDFASFDGTEEQFYAIVSALSDMDDKTQMVAIANDIFGDKLANELLPMIYAGTDAINEYCDEYEELGALTDEQTSALAEFDNVMNKIKTQLSNVAAQIGASLLPIMEEIAGIISDVIVPKLQALADWFNSLSLSQQEFALSALLVVAALAPLAVGIGKIITLAGNVIKIIPKISAALSTLAAHPIILIIGVIAAILVVLYTRCEAFREAINNIISTLTDALSPIMDTITTTLSKIIEFLSPIIEMIGDSLAAALNDVMQILSPLFDVVSFIFELLEPLLSVALLPLQVALTALSVPLQLLGSLLNWLAPLFTMFGNIVRGVFEAVIEIVNYVLGFVEDAINWVIRMINGLIDGVNAALGVLGVSIGHISEVSLRINTGDLAEIEDVALDTTAPDNVYEDKDTSIYNGDTYNYDYSTSTKTQNVTVTIENYASEMDVDDLVQQINIKLAEAM
jgi:hypothetical protein